MREAEFSDYFRLCQRCGSSVPAVRIECRASTSNEDQDHDDEDDIRDIHALTPSPPSLQAASRGRGREARETGRHLSSSLSATSQGDSSNEDFTILSREFNALLNIARATLGNVNNGNDDDDDDDGWSARNNLSTIRDEETNALAIVRDDTGSLNAVRSPRFLAAAGTGGSLSTSSHSEMSLQRVMTEEVEAKVSAWESEKVTKINNRRKREEAIISGWENEQIQKSTSWMKKVERKLEEKRARAEEKMQNEVAKAQKKAKERRAAAEAKRGTKLTRVFNLANKMRAVGRPPANLFFFF